jgi:zinc-ribbon domain
MFCDQCGSPVPPEARFCPSCGASLAPTILTPSLGKPAVDDQALPIGVTVNQSLNEGTEPPSDAPGASETERVADPPLVDSGASCGGVEATHRLRRWWISPDLSVSR